MTATPAPDLIKRLSARRDDLPPKSRILADYVLKNPGRAVFMRVRGLAKECGVSESTVMRFVAQMGYESYLDFIQALRDYLDVELSILDRVELTDNSGGDRERLRRIVFEEIDNLRRLYETMDMDAVRKVVEHLDQAPEVYVVGSRLSYSMAFFLGWSLMKLRPAVRILEGSNNTTFDWLTTGPEDSLLVAVATSRYPNDLLRLVKYARLHHRTVVAISDGARCPLFDFAHVSLAAPSAHLTVMGSLSSLSCLISFLGFELLKRRGPAAREQQEKLEQLFREQDIMFNLDRRG